MRISFSFVMRDLSSEGRLTVVSRMNKTMDVVCMMPGLCGNLRSHNKVLVN
jgi:hypothetical protein